MAGINMFELLGEEGEVKPAPKVAPAAAKKPAPAAPVAQPQQPQQQQANGDDRRRRPAPAAGGRGPAGAAPASGARNAAAPVDWNSAPVSTPDWGAPGSQREHYQRDNAGRGAPRGGAFPRGANKRPFDRRSGTGRGYEDKKGGSGRGNWGRPGAELDEQLAAANGEEPRKVEGAEVAAAASDVATAEAGDVASAFAAADSTVVADEPKPELDAASAAEAAEAAAAAAALERERAQISYEDYLRGEAARKAEKLVAAAAPARVAGEGVDASEWDKFVPLAREDDVEEKTPAKEAPKPAKKGKVLLNDVLRVLPRERHDDGGGRGGRGGRGGFAGGRGGRGGGRGGGYSGAPGAAREGGAPSRAPARASQALSIDESSFPALA